MKKFIAAAMLAGFVTVTGASSAMAAAMAPSSSRTPNDPIARCLRAGGTEKFCVQMNGWQYFAN